MTKDEVLQIMLAAQATATAAREAKAVTDFETFVPVCEKWILDAAKAEKPYLCIMAALFKEYGADCTQELTSKLETYFANNRFTVTVVGNIISITIAWA